MMEEKTFPAGTMAKCNRCNQRCPLPKECVGHAENVRTFRLETMCTLDCGHMDAHWVLVSDVVVKPLAVGKLSQNED